MIDFLVIGGGIAGVSAAARLSEHAQVTLLEGESALGYHTSGRSAALYEPNYGSPSTCALSHAGKAFFQTHKGGYLTPRGMMLVGGPDQKDAFEVEIAKFKLNPIRIEDALTRVPILNPKTVGFVGHHDGALDIDTDRLIQDFARDVRANGGQVLTGHSVTKIDKTDFGWRVTSNKRSFATRQIVNAAGSWADGVAQMAGIDPLGITPYRRSIARIPAPGGHDVSHWPMFMGVGETWYAKPDAGALLVSPAEEHRCEAHDAFADDMVLAEGIARYEERMTEPVTRLISNWAGLRSFAPDRALVLGPDPTCPSFIWSAGQGGYGFQTAPGASQFLCDMVLGQSTDYDTDIIAALRPDRLR